ncbi:RNA polymerase sigma factor [Planktotalea sp.]|uniref:RNA polymerase sigma factor n=1 Tax=Planktotalea sp. TaxID=2029877 RepID=UPI003D6BFB99
MNALKTGLVPLLPRLRRFAWSLTRDWPDADDLVQTSCTRALDKATQWDSSTKLDAWMFRLMRNVWVDETRKRKVRIGQGVEDATDSAELLTGADSETKAYANQVLTQIAALPEGFGTVLLLVAVEGHSYAETAEIMDIPIGTVMSRLSSARQKLRSALADQKEVRR